MILYVDSSAVLSYLFQEPKANIVDSQFRKAQKIVTSKLTLLETKRAIVRGIYLGHFKPALKYRLSGLLKQWSAGWELCQIDDDVMERSSENFPVEPVRALDAIHLATILKLLEIYPDLKVLTFDKRQLVNLEALGVEGD